MAFALLGLEIARRQQPAKPAVGRPIRRIGQHLEAVDRHQARADDKLDVSVAGFAIGAHDTGKGVAIGNADGSQAERVGARNHFLRMRSAAQEGKIRGHG